MTEIKDNFFGVVFLGRREFSGFLIDLISYRINLIFYNFLSISRPEKSGSIIQRKFLSF